MLIEWPLHQGCMMIIWKLLELSSYYFPLIFMWITTQNVPKSNNVINPKIVFFFTLWDMSTVILLFQIRFFLVNQMDSMKLNHTEKVMPFLIIIEVFVYRLWLVEQWCNWLILLSYHQKPTSENTKPTIKRKFFCLST